MRLLNPLKKPSCARAQLLRHLGVLFAEEKGLMEAKRRPQMGFKKTICRTFLAVALGSLFAMGAMAQPASAAPRDGMHRTMRNSSGHMHRDVRMRRVNRRIRRNRRELLRSNREFGRHSVRSRRIRRRLRRNRRQRYAMNRDTRHGSRQRGRDRRSV